jgi:hypothetical protein
MALAARRIYETIAGSTIRLANRAGASLTFYRGAYLVIDGGDYKLPTDAASKIPAGVYTGLNSDPATGALVTGSSGMPQIEVERGLIWCPFGSAAQTDVGLLFYLADSEDVTKTAGSKTYALRCVGFKTGHVLLDFDNPIDVS